MDLISHKEYIYADVVDETGKTVNTPQALDYFLEQSDGSTQFVFEACGMFEQSMTG